jgi:diguanylate cyclase (GGDEF)-like protein
MSWKKTVLARPTDRGAIRVAYQEDISQLGLRIRPYIAGINIGFALLFIYLQVWPLVASYVASLFFDLWIHGQNRRQPDQYNPLLPLIWFVIFMQTLLSVWALGAEAGFQYYLLATIPPGFASMNRPFAFKLLHTAVIIVFFLACDIWLRDMRPLYPQMDSVLATLRHINTVGASLLLVGVSYAQALLVKESGDALRQIASTDLLTGLLNRRSFSEIAEREIARSRRGGHPLTLALGDIDFFKRINDSYGHAAGDHLLQNVSNLLQGAVRDYDCVARWGGEEFVFLLPDTDISLATHIVERLRELVASSHQSFEGQSIPVTMTFGVAQFAADENWHAIVARADEALYRGKTDGRNRVEVG